MREPGTLRSVFISSTSVDLREHRAAIKAAIERMDQHPIVMENFGAQGQGDATSISLQQLNQADLYVLIVAWRYGFVPEGQELSITHQEYLEAVGKMPCFVYLADPSTDGPDHDSIAFPATNRDPEHRTQLETFRAELQKAHILDTFISPGDLAVKVVTALHKHLIREVNATKARERGVPRDLPPRAPGFVGREGDLRELCEELRQGQSVGLSAVVSGMAGVGKSALAAEVLHSLAADEPDHFPGGITWVRCDGFTGLTGLASLDDQILASWNASLPSDLANAATTPEAAVTLREQALRIRLRPPVGRAEPDPALVLLDNVEPGLPLGRAVETLKAGGIRLLITSRAEPSVRGLHMKRLDVLDVGAAVKLFGERFAAAGGSWEAAHDQTASTDVVNSLGRLPLAIELAAARAGRNRMGIADLEAEMRAPDVLSKLRDPLDPTASVRYAFEQTVGTDAHPGSLTSKQRARFIALGLPKGPDWPRELIEAFFEGMRPSAADASSGADDLEALIAFSLVSLGGSESDIEVVGSRRVRLHPLLRQYAAELWRGQNEDDCKADIGALLVALYDFVGTREHDFGALAREEALITSAIITAKDKKVASELTIALVNSLQDYIFTGGHWRLGLELYTAHQASSRLIGNRLSESDALHNLGTLADDLGDKAAARAYYDQALAIRREVGDRAGEGVTLNNLGKVASDLGDKAAARAYYDQALAITREVGDRAGEGVTLNNLGGVADDLGDKAAARAYYDQALAIRREVGDRAGEGVTLNNLGAVASDLGDKAAARAYYDQALAITREVGDRAGEGVTLNNLGGVASDLGDKAAARAYYDQALAIRREVGDRAGEGVTLNNLGKVASDLGDKAAARAYYDQALAIRREVGDRAGEGVTLNNLGGVASDLGDKAAARAYFDQALRLFQAIGAVMEARVVQENLAAVVGNQTVPEPEPEVVPSRVSWWPFGRRRRR